MWFYRRIIGEKMKSTLQTTPVNVLTKAHMTNANDMAFGR
jgi:hypothetical protein